MLFNRYDLRQVTDKEQYIINRIGYKLPTKTIQMLVNWKGNEKAILNITHYPLDKAIAMCDKMLKTSKQSKIDIWTTIKDALVLVKQNKES